MNKEILKGNWKEVKGKIRLQWGKLTDDELDKMQGSYEQLQGALQKKYGLNKETSEKQLNEFFEKNFQHLFPEKSRRDKAA